MDRKKYYAERSKLRSMRNMVFSGWYNKRTIDKYANEVLNLVEEQFDARVLSSIHRREAVAFSIMSHRAFAWSNSRGTRPINVKKAGRK